MFQSLRYVQDQAERGAFRRHSTALHVLLYLVMNMWVKPNNPEDAGPGEVMYGKSAIDKICGGTALGRTAVKDAIRWLASEEWIATQRTHDGTGREDRRYFCVRLDMPAHRERLRLRAAGEALDRIVREGSPNDHREGSPNDHPIKKDLQR
jgi:hypothetical protein